jgi:hypothetical protein
MCWTPAPTTAPGSRNGQWIRVMAELGRTIASGSEWKSPWTVLPLFGEEVRVRCATAACCAFRRVVRAPGASSASYSNARGESGNRQY